MLFWLCLSLSADFLFIIRKVQSGHLLSDKIIDFTVKNPITGGTLFHLDWSPSIPNLPGRIPPLAQGAVIPPNAPFLAMLGDQTKGNNIEAPEDLIRKIVREESGGRDRNYTFIAQLNGRTLFSQMVTEAELRQMQTGRNPFELA